MKVIALMVMLVANGAWLWSIDNARQAPRVYTTVAWIAGVSFALSELVVLR